MADRDKPFTRSIIRKVFMACGLCLFLSACGAHHGAARITSQPSGAQIVNIDNGKIMGTTPMTLNFTNSNSERLHLPVKLVKEGYYDKVESFWLSMRHSSQKKARQNPKVVKIELVKRGNPTPN